MGSLKALPLGHLPTRGRAEEFARALDAAGPDPRPTATVGLAQRLAAAGEALAPLAAPRTEFRSALRTRLTAVAAVRSPSPSIPVVSTQEWEAGSARWGSSRRAQRTLGLAAGAMASCVAVTGVAVAGSQSLPGDPFYPVKRTTEALQLAATGGDIAKGQRHLDFAATRLRELRALTSGRGSSEQVGARVQTTLADMDAETRKGTALLTDAFRSSQAPAPLQTLSKFVTAQSVQLERLLPALPPESQNFAVASLALVADVADDTEDLMELEACQADCAAPVTPTASPRQTPTPGPTPSGSPSPEATVTPSPGATPSPSGTPEPSLAGTPDDEVSPRPTGTVSPGLSPSGSPSPSSSTESARPQDVDLLPRPTRSSSWLLPLPL